MKGFEWMGTFGSFGNWNDFQSFQLHVCAQDISTFILEKVYKLKQEITSCTYL